MRHRCPLREPMRAPRPIGCVVRPRPTPATLSQATREAGRAISRTWDSLMETRMCGGEESGETTSETVERPGQKAAERGAAPPGLKKCEIEVWE